MKKTKVNPPSYFSAAQNLNHVEVTTLLEATKKYAGTKGYISTRLQWELLSAACLSTQGHHSRRHHSRRCRMVDFAHFYTGRPS